MLYDVDIKAHTQHVYKFPFNNYQKMFSFLPTNVKKARLLLFEFTVLIVKIKFKRRIHVSIRKIQLICVLEKNKSVRRIKDNIVLK